MQGKRFYSNIYQRSIFLVSILILSCVSLSNASPANDTTGKLMTEFGEFTPVGSHWTVRISSGDRQVHIIRHWEHGITEDTQQGWKAGQGWFVYVENDERVWAYDGDQNLFLLVRLGDLGTAVHGLCDLQCAVPDEVLVRFSPAAKRIMKSPDK
jgi:hypothetical protein